ncbi:flagellar basal body rod protein FlgB [Pseudoduganella ginsengisoli]|uniref:Flagellar basal body rod protein FlgB n=1 Tax=Pseudoduganella ginsengisoli TaxID=1462440 RepID=A0A6L6Q9T6_9BURK|nr:flagellar basal body protein [Pseudoduganella ginsengisoli]MTW05961.1 flagellar basal body protein [Pseudoduganella ginsengisoli]
MPYSTAVVTVDMARLALDAASLRHQAIANNIANVNSAGYTPLRVDFEQQMGAARAALAQGTAPAPAMLRGVTPVLVRDAAPAAGDRSALLDMEVSALAQNTVQYEALAKALGKHLGIMAAVISEGKR